MDLDFEEMDKYLLSQNNKIIHQVWFGTIPSKRAAKKTYKKLKVYRDSWKIKNPTWCHIEWNKEKCLLLMKTVFPEHLDMYKRYKWEIQRCDAIRTFILFRYGGWYADMDYFCNRPFDEVHYVFKGSIYLVQTPNHNDHGSNSLMYSQKGHVFWKKVFMKMEEVKTNFDKYINKHYIVVATTGPTMLNKVYHEYKFRYGISLLPHNLFHPYSIQSDVRSIAAQSSEIFAVHFGQMTWGNNTSRIIIFLAREWLTLLLIIIVMVIPSLLRYLLTIRVKE